MLGLCEPPKIVDEKPDVEAKEVEVYVGEEEGLEVGGVRGVAADRELFGEALEARQRYAAQDEGPGASSAGALPGP